MGKTSFVIRVEGGRLTYYKNYNESQNKFWDEHWQNQDPQQLKSFYRPYLKGYLGYGMLAAVLKKYLPAKGLILEGGCGLAQYVVALRALGYNCIGIDYAENTIKQVRAILPDLPVSIGNICRMEFNNSAIDAYISLGVMEHFLEGPEKALLEAYRVLKDKGFLLVGVPQFFPGREKEFSMVDQVLPKGFNFYQFAFPPDDFRNILTASGFKVLAEYGYASSYGLRIKSAVIRQLAKKIPSFERIDIFLDRSWWWSRLARMRLYVAQKA